MRRVHVVASIYVRVGIVRGIEVGLLVIGDGRSGRPFVGTTRIS